MAEPPGLTRRADLMRAIERRAGCPVFAQDPYVKFLPLILHAPSLEWSLAGRCDPESHRRIVIVAYGRDPIAHEGWLRFALIAAYSILHCAGIESWALDVVVGGPPSQYLDLPATALFGAAVEPDLALLRSFGVTVSRRESVAAPGDVYRSYVSGPSLLLRLDADAGLLPGALQAPCFTFQRPLGHSGLNGRHNGRCGLDQLVHAADGRMKHWPAAMRVSARVWAECVVQAGAKSLGSRVDRAVAMARMRGISWPSEGLSYLQGDLVGAFVALRDQLVYDCCVPAWDEESVKLAMVGVLGLEPEPSRIPVLEHWEYGPTTPDAAAVNFRNRQSLSTRVSRILDCGGAVDSTLSYVADFVADIKRRAAARWCAR